jgi:Flp pilus assembly protein TadG
MKRPLRSRRQRGAAAIEFALILPLLLLLAMITTEFGRAIYQYNTIVKSVRQAARYLSVQPPNTNVAQAKNLVVYGNVAGTGTPLVTGLAVSQVSIPAWTLTGSDPLINTVTVTVTGYKFTSLFVSVFGQAFADANKQIAFSDISATMRGAL